MSANPSRESGDMQSTEKPKQYLMTEGPIHQRVLRYAIPVFIGYLFQQLYNTADALIVGNLVGRNALAAVTSTGSIVYLAVGTFTGFSMGAGIVIARYIGAEDPEKTSQTVHTAVAMGLFFSVLFTALGVLFSPVILRAMGTPEDVFADAALYLKIYFAGCTGLVMYNIFVGILQASGDSTHPLYYLITSSAINVVLDITLIGVFHMGVDGAAIATIVSQGIAALLVMIRLLRQSGDIRISFSKIGFHWRRLREIVLFGLPTAVQNTVIDFSNVLIQSYINSFSAAAMAGIGAYAKVEGFAFLPVTAFSMAMATFISQNIGAQKLDRVKEGIRFGLLCSVAAVEVVGIIMFLFAPQLVAAFNQDPNVIAYGVLRGRVCSLFFCLLGFSHVSAAVFRGLGKPMVPMLVMLICWCAVRVLVLMTIGQIYHNILLACWIYPITWGMSTVVDLVYLGHVRKKGYAL